MTCAPRCGPGPATTTCSGVLSGVWSVRRDRYSEERGELSGQNAQKIEMSHIGG